MSEDIVTTASLADLKQNFSDPTAAPTAENVFSREGSDMRLGSSISTGSNLGLYSTSGPDVLPMCADAFTCNYVTRLLCELLLFFVDVVVAVVVVVGVVAVVVVLVFFSPALASLLTLHRPCPLNLSVFVHRCPSSFLIPPFSALPPL